jgi:hypothetical protein
MKKKLLFLCLFSLAATANAQGVGQGIGVHHKCKAFVEALDSRSYNALWKDPSDGEVFATMSYAYMSWIQGFISATNLHRPKNGQISMSAERIADWVKNYCKKHPNELVYMGAKDIVEKMPAGYH